MYQTSINWLRQSSVDWHCLNKFETIANAYWDLFAIGSDRNSFGRGF